jgi:hypothetical protein
MKGWRAWGECIDKLRVIPRLLLALYTWQLTQVTIWAMSLKDLSGGQAAFVSTVWGAYAMLLNFYMQNSTAWPDQSRRTVSQSIVQSEVTDTKPAGGGG